MANRMTFFTHIIFTSKPNKWFNENLRKGDSSSNTVTCHGLDELGSIFERTRNFPLIHNGIQTIVRPIWTLFTE
jgi:hypothetical protein